MNESTESTEVRLPLLPARKAQSHKGDYGRVLLVGGSRGMAGAIGLAGKAALRGGAGVVRLAVPETSQDVVAGYEPCYMTCGLSADTAGRIGERALPAVISLAGKATAVGWGPGLGQSANLTRLTGQLYQRLTQPMVVDADGLNALAEQRELLAFPGGPRILTPHPGEFARLVGQQQVPPDDRDPLAENLADHCGVIVVLKGHRTLVTDGKRESVNTTGNPGMATGGTGDVLTGLLVALLAQGMTVWDAARLGVYIHGLAGDLAVADLGQVALVASDLLSYLPTAIRTLEVSHATEDG